MIINLEKLLLAFLVLGAGVYFLGRESGMAVVYLFVGIYATWTSFIRMPPRGPRLSYKG